MVEIILSFKTFSFFFKTSKFYNTTHHFFELFRFDFLLNENLEPHITEVNMSPAVTPNSDTADTFTQTYEQLIYETLQLVGAGSKADLMSRCAFIFWY